MKRTNKGAPLRSAISSSDQNSDLAKQLKDEEGSRREKSSYSTKKAIGAMGSVEETEAEGDNSALQQSATHANALVG